MSTFVMIIFLADIHCTTTHLHLNTIKFRAPVLLCSFFFFQSHYSSVNKVSLERKSSSTFVSTLKLISNIIYLFLLFQVWILLPIQFLFNILVLISNPLLLYFCVRYKVYFHCILSLVLSPDYIDFPMQLIFSAVSSLRFICSFILFWFPMQFVDLQFLLVWFLMQFILSSVSSIKLIFVSCRHLMELKWGQIGSWARLETTNTTFLKFE